MKKIESRIWTIIAKVLPILMLVITPMIAIAQPDPGDDPDLPIDGGVGLLIAAGVGYGVKMAKDRKAKRAEQSNK